MRRILLTVLFLLFIFGQCQSSVQMDIYDYLKIREITVSVPREQVFTYYEIKQLVPSLLKFDILTVIDGDTFIQKISSDQMGSLQIVGEKNPTVKKNFQELQHNVVKIRLLYQNTPEIRGKPEFLGLYQKEIQKILLEGTSVYLDIVDIDKYGRYLQILFIMCNYQHLINYNVFITHLGIQEVDIYEKYLFDKLQILTQKLMKQERRQQVEQQIGLFWNNNDEELRGRQEDYLINNIYYTRTISGRIWKDIKEKFSVLETPEQGITRVQTP